jgi:hypothetical protein
VLALLLALVVVPSAVSAQSDGRSGTQTSSTGDWIIQLEPGWSQFQSADGLNSFLGDSRHHTIGSDGRTYVASFDGETRANDAIARLADHPAVAFIEWLLHEENQAALQEVLGASSPATEVPRSEAQLAAHPYAPVYDSRTDYAVAQVVEGFETRTPDIRQIVIDSVLRVLQGAAEPHEAMQQAQQQAEAAVN